MLGDATVFGAKALALSLGPRFSATKITHQVYQIGVRCIPVILLVSIFTGLVLGLQGYHTLSQFGTEGLVGAAVALALVRELGPVLTALMVIGQAGSTMAALSSLVSTVSCMWRWGRAFGFPARCRWAS